METDWDRGPSQVPVRSTTMGFSRYKKRYVTAEEMNQHLKYVFNYYKVEYRAKSKDETFKRTAFLEDCLVNFKLTYKKGPDACTYICRKDGEDIIQATDGGEAYRILCKYYKVPKMDDSICKRADEGGLSASPLLWHNPKYEGQWLDAYGYDLNSAYAQAMLELIPDTSVSPRVGTIIEGKEIGFEEQLKSDGINTCLVPKFKGFSTCVFPLMPSPFEKFVKTWYDKKCNALPGSYEKVKAKGILCYSVGYLQKINPFIRACIIGRCNNLIKALIDDDTLFCNTDSIVSRKPLNLNIGSECGQWKLEHQGKVAYKGANYQWDNGDISYRHVPKTWFKKDWDITKDPVPHGGNIYEFKNNRLERIK